MDLYECPVCMSLPEHLISMFQLRYDRHPFSWLMLSWRHTAAWVVVHCGPLMHFDLHAVIRESKRVFCQIPLYMISSFDRWIQWPQNDLETVKINATSYFYYKYPSSPNFNPFHSMASSVWVTGQFDTSAPNDSKWPLTLSGQRYPIYVVLELASPRFYAGMLYK